MLGRHAREQMPSKTRAQACTVAGSFQTLGNAINLSLNGVGMVARSASSMKLREC